MGRGARRQAKVAAREEAAEASRPRHVSREELVLTIVATDDTFERTVSQFFSEGRPLDVTWVGRCIHCNTSLVVALDGETSATIEHIRPLCDDGHPTDPQNLALACSTCNNEKGIRHDRFVGRGGRADAIVTALLKRRMERWRAPNVQATA